MKSINEERKKIAMKVLIRAAIRLIEKRRKSKDNPAKNSLSLKT
jgi:hypothetical protein